MALTILNPYEAVDWSSAEHHKTEYHMHPGKNPDYPTEWGPHDMVDLYADAGYTVFAVGEEGDVEMPWPWTDFESLNANYENRDPESLGLVSYPASEDNRPEHIGSLFSTLITSDIDDLQYSRQRSARNTMQREDHHYPQGLALIAHPNRYMSDPSEDWKKYIYDFWEYSLEDGMIGLEIASKGGGGGIFNDNNAIAWDKLLELFAPHRMIWGYGADDASGANQTRGDMVDIRVTTLLLNPDEFDPSDQEMSRQAAMEAHKEGRMTFSERESWDDDNEDAPTRPQLTDVTIGNNSISISADNAESIEWISSGDVVGSGNSISIDDSHTPYVRAELTNEAEDAIMWTQPFGIDDGSSRTPTPFDNAQGNVDNS